MLYTFDERRIHDIGGIAMRFHQCRSGSGRPGSRPLDAPGRYLYIMPIIPKAAQPGAAAMGSGSMTRYAPGHKQETRARLVKLAADRLRVG